MRFSGTITSTALTEVGVSRIGGLRRGQRSRQRPIGRSGRQGQGRDGGKVDSLLLREQRES